MIKLSMAMLIFFGLFYLPWWATFAAFALAAATVPDFWGLVPLAAFYDVLFGVEGGYVATPFALTLLVLAALGLSSFARERLRV